MATTGKSRSRQKVRTFLRFEGFDFGEKGRIVPSKTFSHLSASILVFLFTVLLFQFDLHGLRGLLLDGLYRTQQWTKPHSDIALVEFNPQISLLSEHPRVPVDELVRALSILENQEPRAVALIGAINESIYSNDELERISEALGRLPHPMVGFTDDASLGRPVPMAFRDRIRYLPAFLSRDTFSFGADSVSRRVMVTIDGFPTAFAELARQYRGMPPDGAFSNVFSHGRLGKSLQALISWQGPPGTYSEIPMGSLSSLNPLERPLRGKVVLVGPSTGGRRSDDAFLTPYSREPFSMSFLETTAQSLGTLMADSGLARSGGFVDLILSTLLGLLTVNLVLSLSPGQGILLVLGEVGLLFATAWALLFGFGYWLNLAHPIIIGCFAYYLVIPYRLLSEYRKRWHYQEKSEMMVQLEQLKSNFLSLVSHDLKTPIARIQGNAELLLSQHPTLDEGDKRSLSTIIETSQDLSEYVQTILDLTRIESAGLPLERTSKDINAVIGEVIESKRFLATDKQITLATHLEPLFSFKFDVRLITRVLANLLENAIKYSPAGSTITFSSKEEGNWIRVAVADKGAGISPEEQPKVFEKFYRCQNETTKTVKGTGLGLYLVKYFVELHRGFVDLKSDLGKGSVFTVSLPVQGGTGL